MNNVFEQLGNYALYLFFPVSLLPFLIVSIFYKTFPTLKGIFFCIIPTLAWFCIFIMNVDINATRSLAALDLVIVALYSVDLFSVVANGKQIVISREVERILSMGSPTEVILRVENHSRRPVTLELIDDSNEYCCALPPLSGKSLLSSELDLANSKVKDSFVFGRRTLGPNECEIVSYRLQWMRRGAFVFEFVAARFFSRLGLWRKCVNYPNETKFQVYPNLCQLAQFETLGRANNLFLLGVRKIRRVGQDNDFERLREYTRDDQYRFIDWKATARRNKLIVRDFQDSRNQRVIIALDAGRMMTNQTSDGASLYDATLNAALALSYIALKQGDEVGVLVFSNEVKRFIPPHGGIAQMNAIIRGLFDIFPERVESRYDCVFKYLSEKSGKRALVVLATNVIDERNAALVEKTLIDMSGTHLPLGVFLREHSLFDAIDCYEKTLKEMEGQLGEEISKTGKKIRLAFWLERFGNEREPLDEIERMLWKDSIPEDCSKKQAFYRAGVAAHIINWRKKTLLSLEVKGALTLDVFPEDAVAPLVNKYLEIKARRLL